MKVRLLLIAILFVMTENFATADENKAIFKIAGKSYSEKELRNEDPGAFFEIEKQKFELVERLAREKYLEHYWQQKAKKSGGSVKAAQKSYFEKNAKVSGKELRETLNKFKDHPQLKQLPQKEREDRIREFLQDKQEREALEGIISAALKSGELVISYPKPVEPVFKIEITSSDNVRYGPSSDDIKPLGCSSNCPITVVEYSEYQCPYCSRVLPAVKQLLSEYKGKIRWIVRDFPLSFHDRARPAAIAAQCAAEQGKFWHMYNALFENQRNLTDSDFEKYARAIKGLDFKKWNDCYKNPRKVAERVDKNFESGTKLGVSGTPAFFVNGRKLAGAMPYEYFKNLFDEAIAESKKKK